MYDRTMLLAKSLMADRHAAADSSDVAPYDAPAVVATRADERPRAAVVRRALAALTRSLAGWHPHLQMRHGHRP